MNNTADDLLGPSFGVSWISTFHMFAHSNISKQMKKKKILIKKIKKKIQKELQTRINSEKYKKINKKSTSILFKDFWTISKENEIKKWINQNKIP